MPTELPPVPIDYPDLALSAVVNLVAITGFAIGIYFRRHARKDLAVVLTFSNSPWRSTV